MLQWKILLIGMSGVGKSSLCKALLQHGQDVVKTQAIEYHTDMIIDMPGEYLSHPQLRRIFLSEVHHVKAVLFFVAANEIPLDIPHGLLQTLPNVELVGIISKMDTEHSDLARSKKFLAAQGIAEPYFPVSIYDTASIDCLRNWLIQRDLFNMLSDDK